LLSVPVTAGEEMAAVSGSMEVVGVAAWEIIKRAEPIPAKMTKKSSEPFLFSENRSILEEKVLAFVDELFNFITSPSSTDCT